MFELAPAIASAMQLVGLARMAVDARDDAKLQAALTDLTLRLNDAAISALASTEKALALQETIRGLQDELRQLQLQRDERERYALAELCPGSYAYKRQEGQHGDNAPPHYLCQPCYDKGVKAMLRYVPQRVSHDAHWTCPEGGKPHTVLHHETALPNQAMRAMLNRGPFV